MRLYIKVSQSSGDTEVAGTLAVAGASTLSTLDVTGATTLAALSAGATSLTSTLGVAGIATLADDLRMSEDTAALTHTGTTGLAITSTSGYVDVEDLRFTGLQMGTATTPKVITVSDSGVTVTGSLSTDDLVFTGDFVIGDDKFKVAQATGNTEVAGTLAVSGATGLADLAVGGAATVSSTLVVAGASTLSDTLAVTGRGLH